MLLVLASLSIAQAAEPTGTLTLACQGTAKLGQKTDPISKGIIVNFADRTVHGFGYPGASDRFDYPVKITGMNEVIIAFHGLNHDASESISGSIDRVTGDVEARNDTPSAILVYTLKCKPTQRMF
jgi:hypothetical protein